MKRLMLPLAFSFLLVGTASFAKEKAIYCMAEMPPYWFKNKEGKIVGAIASYVEAMHEGDQEYEAEMQLYPQKRCEDMVKNGDAHILPMFKLTDERKEYTVHTIPSYYDAVYYWFNKNHNSEASMEFKSVAELKAKGKICGRQGFVFSEANLASTDMDTGTPLVDQLAKKLEAGNCNMIVDR